MEIPPLSLRFPQHLLRPRRSRNSRKEILPREFRSRRKASNRAFRAARRTVRPMLPEAQAEWRAATEEPEAAMEKVEWK
jgi:hypothetical protein